MDVEEEWNELTEKISEFLDDLEDDYDRSLIKDAVHDLYLIKYS